MAVVPLRKQFRAEQELEARKQIAKQELASWCSYLDQRQEELKQKNEHQTAESEIAKLREFFDRFKDHQSHKISAGKLTEFHGEYSKMY
jgi:hypothetical protein